MATSIISKNVESRRKLHVAMFPWFAFGHFTPYLHISNKLAQRGHKVSFFLPTKASTQLHHQNLHPDLITFHPLTRPPVQGLAPEVETASDLPFLSHTLLAEAFDLTRQQVETLLSALSPDFIFYDLGHWVPEVASYLGVKAVMFNVIAANCLGNILALSTRSGPGEGVFYKEFGQGIKFIDRIKTSVTISDAVCFRTCVQVEGEAVEYIRQNWKSPVLLTGPGLPEEDGLDLDPKWNDWLNSFSPSSVVFCALGTQITLEKAQFQELVLGFEATGLPYLAVLKPPVEALTVEEALPEGFSGRGVVHGGWVQQRLILSHPSVGCFVSHLGYGSMWEGLVSDCQIVGLPFLGDQVENAELVAKGMKAAVVVEREEERGWVSKERLCKAVTSVMDEESEIGLSVRKNHSRIREVLTKEGFMSGYIDRFVEGLLELKNAKN